MTIKDYITTINIIDAEGHFIAFPSELDIRIVNVKEYAEGRGDYKYYKPAEVRGYENLQVNMFTYRERDNKWIFYVTPEGL